MQFSISLILKLKYSIFERGSYAKTSHHVLQRLLRISNTNSTLLLAISSIESVLETASKWDNIIYQESFSVSSLGIVSLHTENTKVFWQNT
jgi:hypothetical protein